MAQRIEDASMNNVDSGIIEQIDALTQRLRGHHLYGPAEFWKTLGDQHKDLIRRHGFGKFKRTINFHYHQWSVPSLRDSKIRSLLLELLKHGRLPYGVLLVRMDARAIPRIDNFDPTAYTVFMGLLWQYALMRDRLHCLDICEEPLLGEPLPVTYRGRLISQDLATSAIELNFIAQHVDLSKTCRVAEIGAGYGRLAYVMAVTFPHLQYCIFDIPPALAISQTYLVAVLGETVVQPVQPNGTTAGLVAHSPQRMRAFLPHQLELFPDGYFDLVINISSFDEMSREQVENYFSLIDKKCRGWFYIKGHCMAPHWCTNSAGGLAELPYREAWKLVGQRKDPFSPSFIERIYFIPGGGA